VLQNGRKLEYKKWKERVSEQAKIVDVKDLEVLWPTKTRKLRKNYAWG
jgi:hypothetical protein